MDRQNPAALQAHAWYEDAAALITGIALISLGVMFHATSHLLTGGTTGIALLLGYARGYEFGATFFLINVPFYALAIWRMGWKLTLQTLLAVSLLSLVVRFTPGWLTISALNPVYSAIAGGLLIGVGLLILFRHKISLGGVNLLALFLQQRLGWKAGYVQLAIDGLIIAVAALVVDPSRIWLSLLAALVLNLVIATNHRPDRYTGAS